MESIEEVNDDHDVWMVDLHNLDPVEYELGKLSETSGRLTGETLQYVLSHAKERRVDGVVYAPLNKEALQRGGFHFQDEIHFFADLLQYKGLFSEVNTIDDFWVTRVTSHIPLKDVPNCITKENVEKTIHFAHRLMLRAGYKNPSLAVAALNPHGGEGGLLGREEIEAIAPAVEAAKNAGIDVRGPLSL